MAASQWLRIRVQVHGTLPDSARWVNIPEPHAQLPGPHPCAWGASTLPAPGSRKGQTEGQGVCSRCACPFPWRGPVWGGRARVVTRLRER